MKNKFILSFLLIPVFVACQNTANISSSSSPHPSKSSVSTNNISSSPTNSVIVSTSPSVNISPSITQQPTASDIQESKTPIIESNMMLDTIERPVYTQEKINSYLDNYRKKYPNENTIYNFSGTVFDAQSKAVISDVTVIIKNVQNSNFETYNYDYSIKTKTNSNGYFNLSVPILDIEYSVCTYKEGYTSRYIQVKTFDAENEEYFLTKSPEINKITINNNSVNAYFFSSRDMYPKVYNPGYKVKPEANIPRFKMFSTDKLNIDFSFNNKIIKKSFEESVYITPINNTNSQLVYDNKNVLMNFEWSKDNKSVKINLPIPLQKQNTIYKIGFKDSFIDENNNKVFNNEFINIVMSYFISKNELSENIVFEIAGSK